MWIVTTTVITFFWWGIWENVLQKTLFYILSITIFNKSSLIIYWILLIAESLTYATIMYVIIENKKLFGFKFKKTHTILLLIILSVLLLSFLGVIEINQIKRNSNLMKVSSIIRNSVDNLGKSDFEKAVRLRSHIYRRVPLRQTPKNFSFFDINASYLESLRNDQVGHLCEGLARMYILVLESQGIPARHVSLFTKNEKPNDGHSSVEFWDDGKWYASDPTFNVMFMHEGEYLSYEELYKIIKEGKSYDVVSNGYEIFPDRDINKYYVPLKDLMNFIIIHPARIWNKGNWEEYPMWKIPNEWDGKIKYGKRKIDVTNFAGIYKYFYTGPLR